MRLCSKCRLFAVRKLALKIIAPCSRVCTNCGTGKYIQCIEWPDRIDAGMTDNDFACTREFYPFWFVSRLILHDDQSFCVCLLLGHIYIFNWILFPLAHNYLFDYLDSTDIYYSATDPKTCIYN